MLALLPLKNLAGMTGKRKGKVLLNTLKSGRMGKPNNLFVVARIFAFSFDLLRAVHISRFIYSVAHPMPTEDLPSYGGNDHYSEALLCSTCFRCDLTSWWGPVYFSFGCTYFIKHPLVRCIHRKKKSRTKFNLYICTSISLRQIIVYWIISNTTKY